MNVEIDTCLKTVREWAQSKVSTGKEPPWAWYQYMKLIEAVRAIQAGRRSVMVATAEQRRTEPPREAGVVALDPSATTASKRDPSLPI